MKKSDFPLSNYTYAQLKRACLSSISEKLYYNQELHYEEKYRLIAHTPLPLLGVLVQLKRLSTNWPKLAAARPLICLPIGGMLERKSKQEALDQSAQELSNILNKVQIYNELCLISDYWQGDFEIADLVYILKTLVKQFSDTTKITPLGPSTVDIQSMVRSDEKRSYKETIIDLISTLKSFGVSSIDGGTDLPIHKLAVEQNLQVAIGHLISEKEPGSAQETWAEQFCKDLDYINSNIAPTGKCVVWYPWVDKSINSRNLQDNSLLGVHVLKAIALARLLLPTIKHIRVPWSLLGESISHIALSFGANDLGFGAIDYRTAEQLQIIRISKTTHLAGSPIEFIDNRQKL